MRDQTEDVLLRLNDGPERDAILTLRAQRDAAEHDAHELTKALTGLVGGGSEMFIRKRGHYLADIPYCVERLRERAQAAHRHVIDETLRARRLEQSLRMIASAEGGSAELCDWMRDLARSALKPSATPERTR